MRNTTLTTLPMRLATALLAPLLAPLLALLLALPLGASAAGLGRITVLSALGQPLRAEVEISATREELTSFSARLASAAAFQQAGIEYSASLASIRFNVGQRPNGQPVLSLTSDRAFNEPFLDLLVEATWSSGRLLREYTFLLDPPEVQQKTPAVAAAPVTLPDVKKEVVRETVPAPVATPPAAPVAPPAPVAAAPETRPIAPAEDKAQKKPPADLQVIRGADGVQRIVKVEPQTSEKPTVPATRLVKQGDTLGKIAAETKPEGVNLDQMLVALFRSNQDAFVGNVNRLKAGKILSIPDRDTVSGIAPDDARKTIRAHSADFNAYSKKLAATVARATPQKEDLPQRAASGKIAPKVEEKAPIAAGKDKLEVSKSEAAAADKAGAQRLAAIEETLVSREKALKDANSRIAELEKNLADLKKLIELKNQSMADLQKQAQAAKLPATATPATPAPAPQKLVAKEAEKPVQAAAPTIPVAPLQPPVQPAEPAPATPIEPAPPVAKDKPATETAASAAKPPVEEKKPAPPPPTPPAVEPSFVDDSPEIVYGGSAIVLLLLGYFGYSVWRRKKAAATPEDQEEALSAVIDAGPDKVESREELLSATDFSNQPSAAAPSANVDPVAEAEVYMAYGRDVQAEEILVDALKTDPTRLAIHLKLLEIYAARKSVNQFDAIAQDVHGLTNGSGQDWEKARELGLQVNPGNPLYGGEAAPQAEFDPDATMVIQPQAALEDLTISEEAPPQDMQTEMPVEEAAPEPPVEEAPAEEAASDDVPVSLDFDFDLPLAAQVTPPAEAAEATPASEEPLGKLDIDLGDDAALAASDESISADTLETPSVQEAAPSLDIDFDLDLDAPQAPATEPVPAPSAPAPAAADAGLDFDFDLDGGAPETESAPPEAKPAEAEMAPDGNDIDFDLELPAPAAPVASNVDLSSINLDLDAPLEPAPVPTTTQAAETDDSASQDVATKLELAQAYEEMGDKEGARELLQEVLTEGNAAQKETARGKLAQLG